MATQSLLLCRDPAAAGMLCGILDELGIGAEVCTAHDRALDLLVQRKFNPVIVDCDPLDSAGEVLRTLRQSPENRDVVALGIADDAQMSDAFALGANLVLRKPVSPDEAGRVLRTARALVVRMRRRFLRCVIHTLAWARLDGVDDEPMLLDISEGGFAIQALQPLEERRAFAVRFILPGDPEEYEAIAAVVWSDASGRAGLRFLGMAQPIRERLRDWLHSNGAVGPAEAPAGEILEATPPKVVFPLQLAPLAHYLLGRAFDVAIVAAAVLLFGAISALIADGLPAATYSARGALLLGGACWLAYRYVFFGALRMTPGEHVVIDLADRYAVWLYNRRLQAMA